MTNRGLLGNAFDRDTAPEALGLLHINAGKLGGRCGRTEKTRCDWVDGGLTPISRVASTFGQESPTPTGAASNGSEWYFPRRLGFEIGVGGHLEQTPAGEALGLNLLDASTIDDPLFVIQTELTGGGPSNLLSRATNLVSYSDIPPSKYVPVDASSGKSSQSHLDPLLAAPKKNVFLKKVLPFLKNKAFK